MLFGHWPPLGPSSLSEFLSFPFSYTASVSSQLLLLALAHILDSVDSIYLLALLKIVFAEFLLFCLCIVSRSKRVKMFSYTTILNWRSITARCFWERLPSPQLPTQAWGPWPGKEVAGAPTSDERLWPCIGKAASVVETELQESEVQFFH